MLLAINIIDCSGIRQFKKFKNIIISKKKIYTSDCYCFY